MGNYYYSNIEQILIYIFKDAIFAIDKNNFSLADFIFISLLMSLREKIIYSDNSNCMKLLMQQDLRIDCLNLLKRALYLQNPEVNAS